MPPTGDAANWRVKCPVSGIQSQFERGSATAISMVPFASRSAGYTPTIKTLVLLGASR